MAELIELSDDDDICEISAAQNATNEKAHPKVFKCLNPDCRSTSNLLKASISIRRYFGVEAYYKKTRVCRKCFNVAETERKGIIEHLRSGTNLFSKEICLKRNTVVLSESDSDKTDDEPSSEESEWEYDLNEIQGNTDVGEELGSDDEMSTLKSVVLDLISEMSLNKHMLDGQTMVGKRLEEAEKGLSDLNLEYNSIENKIDKIRKDFYEAFKVDEKYLAPIEIGPPELFETTAESAELIAEPVISNSTKLPPIGPLKRCLPKVNEMVYVMKNDILSKWVPAKLLDIKAPHDPKERAFVVQATKNTRGKVSAKRSVPGKFLAYFKQCPTCIPVGTRVIAIFDENDSQSLYVGIIAENPTGVNKFRYLIFFDDGYAQYINHQNVRVVIQSSTHVWEDVAVKSRDFIKDYLQTYPERPMVRLLKYKYIKTELDGKWWKAQVLEIDGSLVKMFFPALDRNEWIYRGSTRLSPLFEKKLSMKVKSEFPNKIIRRRTMPVNKSGTFVEYVNFDNVEKESQELALVKPQVEKRSVARKSSAAKPSNLNTIPIKDQLVLESEGFYTSHKQNVNIPKFYRHQCSPKCIKESNEIIYSKVKSPLVKPLLLGWNREVSTVKKRTIERMVCNYVAPCGRRLRSLEEILMYLRLTKSSLEVDFFTVDKDISLRRLWIPSKSVYYDKDITDGKEDIHISCVNSIENESPNQLIYSSVRIPSVNVDLNLNPEYLVCCSCEDDCKDKSQCECWQLTLDSASPFTKDNKFDIGYKYRRLSHQVSTGIFECNSQCSCKKSCLNRVVQFPIRQQLQLFKTAKRGWGVRTLNDIPKGSFICVYVGKVLTETEANEDGMIDGADDYYANLDFIEVVTSMKEGYESEAENIEGDELPDSGWSDLDEGGKDSNGRESHPRKRSRGKKDAASNGTSESRFLKQSTQNGNDSEESNDSTIPCPQTFEPSKNAGDLMWTKQSFNREEDMTMYVMDAKTTGNVGRYLNHSCEPNVFVQNVFVDTHDLKFPWISFFAGNNIKAGMELTWDYNYDVGSVPGRVKYCYCRSNNCRGRLL